MIPSLVADPVHGSGNFASLGGYDIDRIRVSDRCAITVESSSGTVFLWDITNMVDPEQDVILYPNGGVFNNPWIPFFNGQNAFEDISQMELVQGYIFLANSMSNNAGPGTDMGVTRIVWPDETNPDSLNSVAPGLNSVNDSVNGPGKYINHFEVYGTGTYVYTAFDNSNDYFLGGATYDGLAGEKWDWSDALNPSIALDYKMDRYFYNYNYKIVGDTTATPVFLNNGPFYGGASIAFSPVTDPTGTYDAFVAGFNYVGVFNTAGSSTSHYTAGMDHIDDWAGGEQTPGSSARNVLNASDDSFVLYWYNEGFAIMDPSNYGIRMGAWELPGRTDWVRNVQMTNDNHYALVAAGRYGLIIVDLSNPAHPTTVGNWWTNPTTSTYDKQPVTYVFVPQEVGLARYAYVQTRVILADGANGFIDHNVLRTLDISNPPLPAEVDHWDGPTEKTFTNDPYGGYPLPNNFRIVWDINDIALVKVYYGGSPRYWVQISNGQSGDWGHMGFFHPQRTTPKWATPSSRPAPVHVGGGPVWAKVPAA